jgi:hypothetical protein
MLRALSSILVVLMVLALVVGIVTVLAGGVSSRMETRGVWRLTALDGVGPTDGPEPRLRAALHAEGDRPVPGRWLFFRVDDGFTTFGWVNQRGVAMARDRGVWQPQPGVYRFTVGLPETDPRLGLMDEAKVWVYPADMPVVWVDAAALVPTSAAGAVLPAAAPPPAAALDALQTLAQGRLVVYLVRADPPLYGDFRRSLRAAALPPGPAYWVRTDQVRQRLSGLRGVWSRVERVVAAAPDVADAVARMRLPVLRVPEAGAPVQDRAHGWRQVTGQTGGRSSRVGPEGR